MPESDLLVRTRELLHESSESMREIAAGAGVNYWWLRKFNLERFDNPGVVPIVKLHRYLTEKENDMAQS